MVQSWSGLQCKVTVVTDLACQMETKLEVVSIVLLISPATSSPMGLLNSSFTQSGSQQGHRILSHLGPIHPISNLITPHHQQTSIGGWSVETYGVIRPYSAPVGALSSIDAPVMVDSHWQAPGYCTVRICQNICILIN